MNRGKLLRHDSDSSLPKVHRLASAAIINE